MYSVLSVLHNPVARLDVIQRFESYSCPSRLSLLSQLKLWQRLIHKIGGFERWSGRGKQESGHAPVNAYLFM